MRASFFGLHVASSSLNTARTGSTVTAHNMANVGTPGFSRQVAVQRASNPLHTHNATGMVGTGSEIIGIRQIRSIPLDHRFWNESPMLGMHHVRASQLTMMESGFGELEGVGLTSTFGSFFNSIQELSTDPSDPTLRNSFIQNIESLSRTINDRANALRRQQQDVNREVGAVVGIINNIGDQIANINRQIARHEARGDHANDLRDRRATLIDELSGLVNIDVTETHVNGRDRFIIHIDGQQFINDDIVQSLSLSQRPTGDERFPTDAPNLYNIYIGGRPFRMESRTLTGELRGLLDSRDGNATRHPEGHPQAGQPVGDHLRPGVQGNAFRGIPYYLERLNQLVRTISDAFNLGLDANGDPIPGKMGHMNGFQHNGATANNIPLFVGNPLPDGVADAPVPNPALTPAPDGGPVGDEFLADGTTPNPNYGMLAEIPANAYRGNINVFNFSINPEILANHLLLNTAGQAVNTGGNSDNSLVLAMAELANFESLFREGTINDFINAVTGELAMDLRDAVTFTESQTKTMEVIQNQRISVKGVEMNEEMTNLIFFQHHFQASSRLISAMNDIYDTMINRMGV